MRILSHLGSLSFAGKAGKAARPQAVADIKAGAVAVSVFEPELSWDVRSN